MIFAVYMVTVVLTGSAILYMLAYESKVSKELDEHKANDFKPKADRRQFRGKNNENN